MKISIKQIFGLAAASCLALAGQSFAAPPAGHGPGFSSPGNSTFGHSQAMSPTTGSINSTYGRTTAANARAKTTTDADDQNDQDREVKTKKVKKTKLTAPGNSAFGRSQRVNHLKGSGNNIYGKTTSANAKTKSATKKNSHATDR